MCIYVRSQWFESVKSAKMSINQLMPLIFRNIRFLKFAKSWWQLQRMGHANRNKEIVKLAVFFIFSNSTDWTEELNLWALCVLDD
jgi:hypothetical protein